MREGTILLCSGSTTNRPQTHVDVRNGEREGYVDTRGNVFVVLEHILCSVRLVIGRHGGVGLHCPPKSVPYPTWVVRREAGLYRLFY